MKSNCILFFTICLLGVTQRQWIMAQQSTTRFPLAVSSDGRHFVDAAGRPFLYQADTGWMLLLNLTKPEALHYLQTRRAQGFNAIQAMLTGFIDQQGESPRNRAGDTPFANEFDFARPNEAYFDHATWVARQADSLGLVLSLAPLWAGCCGEGWAGKGPGGNKPMTSNGPQKSRQFGQYLGKKFSAFKNIIWIMGGDNDPHADREAMRQLALGLKQTAPGHLITYHAASTHSSTDVWQNEPWLDVMMIYTYFRGFNKAWNKNQPDVYEAAYAEYNKRPVKPFFLGESTYEGEHDAWGSALQARKQAYWAILGGSTGHAYGSPSWRCDSSWRSQLQLPGASSLRHLPALFTALPWTKLVPDTANRLAVDGRGEFASNNYAVTAVAGDGSCSVSYLPAKRTLSLDLSRLAGKTIRASWYNPRTGSRTPIGQYTQKQVVRFTPPGPEDWVLVVTNETIGNSPHIRQAR